MHTDYSDIRSRIPEEPSWFDEFAVPRYGPFKPEAMANFYAREAALIFAACQVCGRHFRLAMSRPRSSVPDLATAICHGGLWYGDPPNVGCCSTGPMSMVDELEVLEYWWRELGNRWVRETSFEIDLVSDPESSRPGYYFDAHGNPLYPITFGAITEDPGGAQFQELAVELSTRYPAAPREATEAALRSVWRKRMFSVRCLQDAEGGLSDYQWPARRPGDDRA
jgi:hypothetical protein